MLFISIIFDCYVVGFVCVVVCGDLLLFNIEFCLCSVLLYVDCYNLMFEVGVFDLGINFLELARTMLLRGVIL